MSKVADILEHRRKRELVLAERIERAVQRRHSLAEEIMRGRNVYDVIHELCPLWRP